MWKVTFRRHMVTHTGDLPFKCQKCEKGFIFSCDLRKHEWSHNVEKPYQCKQCGKAFKGPESIKKNMKEFTGQRSPMNVSSVVKPSII